MHKIVFKLKDRKKTQVLQHVQIKAIDIRIIFHINDILNDLWKFLMQVYKKILQRLYLTTRRSTSLTVQ